MGTFVDRVQTLRNNVGRGHVQGKVEVNQRYAADQEWHDEYDHPDGGKAFYLRDPLYSNLPLYMSKAARGLLSEDGKGFTEAVMDSMEHLSTEGVFAQAPWEFADLRASGHPYVMRDGDIIHDRPPHVLRLTDAEISEKRRLSRLLDPVRYAK